jgi:hypothetical protein
MLHFAYGSNMDRALMRRHAPAAVASGIAALADHRFIISADGYASIEKKRGAIVHGVLWRLTPRDRARLDAWESVGSGLYRAEILPVRRSGTRAPALIYIGRRHGLGRPKPGYMELVVAAARAWRLPDRYIESLRHYLPAEEAGGRPRRRGEREWTSLAVSS